MISSRRAGLFAGMFLISLATLFLEVLQTRIFSVMLWHHLTYMVVTFTLLGFAASGTVLAVMPRLFGHNSTPRLAIVSALFAITTVLSFLILTFVRLDTVTLLRDRTQYLYIFLYYIYLVIPYFFAGLVVGAVLKTEIRSAPRLYAVNLAGSAVGCYLFIELLRPLGGASCVVFAAALGGAAASAFAWSSGRRALTWSLAAMTVAAAILVPLADTFLVIEPAPSKTMAQEVRMARARGEEPPRVVASEWDPLCRIDVVAYPDSPHLKIYQDADAPTVLFAASNPPDYLTSVYALGYHLLSHPKTLVIGVGGGQDLWNGYLNGARSVTAAEINPTIIELMTGRFRELSGGIYDKPADPANGRGKVQVYLAEGRSFVRRSHETYDLIQMTGTDTYTALSSGAYVMSESYLYTVEAFEDYLDHLEPGGVVAVLRFRFDPPRESLRLVIIAATAMRAKGIENPEDCVAVLTMRRSVVVDGRQVSVPYAVMLFKKGPLSSGEIDKLRRFVRIDPKVFRLSYVPGGEEMEAEFRDYFRALSGGPTAERAFIDAYPFNVAPTTDDAPFFFRYHRWSTLWHPPANSSGPSGGDVDEGAGWFGVIGQDPVGLYILVTVLVEAVILIMALVLAPLWFFRREGMHVPGKAPVFAFFFMIGLGFLLLEIAAMQKFVLYLGHPTYSITVVLASFLLFSGFGSFAAGRCDVLKARPALIAIPTIVVVVIAYAVLLPELFDATLGWPVAGRVGLSGALLAVPSFFMGMPFPTGLRLADRIDPALVPWAWAVNGSASVLASILSIIVAMAVGFTVVFVIAAACYLLAGLSLLGMIGGSRSREV